MKKYRWLIGWILCSAFIHASAQNVTSLLGDAISQKSKLNIGIKAGFASSMTFTDQFKIGEYRIDNIQNEYKLGYFISIFNRYNLRKHHLIQPEFNLTVVKGNQIVQKDASLKGLIVGNLLIKSKVTTIDFMPLYGYKFINQGLYGMAIFVGPKVSWIWEQQSKSVYYGFYQQQLRDELKPFNIGLVTGLAVNIGKLFYDFRYDIGLMHTLREVSFDEASTPDAYKNERIIIKRRRNILSFSVGIMF